MSDDYAGRRAVIDCPVIGEKLPPIRQTVADELVAAQAQIRLAAGRLRTAGTLCPDSALDLLPELLDHIATYLVVRATQQRAAAGES